MGFFFTSKHESQGKELKKVLKHADLTGAQQQEFLEAVEHERKRLGSDHIREDHVKAAMRRLKDTLGDSLKESHIERAGRHVMEHLAGPAETVREAPKPKEPGNALKFQRLPDSVEVPKEQAGEVNEPDKLNREGGEGRLDKAA